MPIKEHLEWSLPK